MTAEELNKLTIVWAKIPIDSLPTKKFHEIVGDTKYVMMLPNGRIKFDDGSGKVSSPAFGSVILLFTSECSSRRITYIEVNKKRAEDA